MGRSSTGTFFRLYDAGEDPEALLDPENHWSAPWGTPDHGACDKCGGSGSTEYECRSCLERADTECLACEGRIRFRDACPACEGTGVIDKTTRRGVSVFPSLGGLRRYLEERNVDLDGSVVIQLEGELTDERDLDADAGALLVWP